jgi:NAD+ kinase
MPAGQAALVSLHAILPPVSGVHTMSQFSTIGLIGRKEHPGVEESLQVLVDYLASHDEITLIIDEATADVVEQGEGYDDLQILSPEEMAQQCDLVIVVGGDGSMLKVAPLMAEYNTPVVGVNRGTLGFMTDILPDEVEERIALVLAGEYKIETRFLLDVSAEHKGEIIELGCALNDVVIHPGIAAQMIEFELYIDDEFVYNQASDGLIVATPTGSTAYSMSAGGPIMHPRLDAMVLVPMYPHSLSSRPIVIDANCEVTIVVGDRHNINPQVSCDGLVTLTTEPGDRIMIGKKPSPLTLIHPSDYNYYETCRSKLGWSSRLGKD